MITIYSQHCPAVSAGTDSSAITGRLTAMPSTDSGTAPTMIEVYTVSMVALSRAASFAP